MTRPCKRATLVPFLGAPMRAWLFVAVLCPCFGQAALPLPRGEVITKVTCLANPRFSYALYLPSAYREDQTWPVLFGFSPGGRGEEPVRLFREAAERFGWIVVGSHDSRNGPLRPAVEGSDALWKDVTARFKVDPARHYSVGFSGGSRMALRLALKHPKQFAGLISIGAFGTGDGLLTGLGHLHFLLLSGLEDFNHWEMLEGRQELRSRGWQALAYHFEGGHRWPPEAIATMALTFLQFGAARKGFIPRDPALENDFQCWLETQAEAAGRTLLALRRWQELALWFPETAAGRKAAGTIPLLEKEPAVRVELRLEKHYQEKSGELPKIRSTGIGYHEFLVKQLAALAQAPPAERVMIRRLLGSAIGDHQMAASEALEAKNWERLLAIASNLAALDDREPLPCILMAAALAQLSRPSEALAHLKNAQLRGYRKPEKLRALEWLKPLRGRPDFEELLKAMQPSP